MGEIQTYASNSGDFSFLFVLIIVGTYLLYEVGKAILDKDDDDDCKQAIFSIGNPLNEFTLYSISM